MVIMTTATVGVPRATHPLTGFCFWRRCQSLDFESLVDGAKSLFERSVDPVAMVALRIFFRGVIGGSGGKGVKRWGRWLKAHLALVSLHERRPMSFVAGRTFRKRQIERTPLSSLRATRSVERIAINAYDLSRGWADHKTGIGLVR